DARVGDDAIQRAERFDNRSGRFEDRSAVADVAGDADRVLQPEVVAGPREQADARPARGERAGDRGTDAAARPRDERDALVHALPLAALLRRDSESSVAAASST